eukprot:5975776-Prymnesium_polylepis.2
MERKVVARRTAAASSLPSPCGSGASCQKRSPSMSASNCARTMVLNVSPSKPAPELVGCSHNPPIHRSMSSAEAYNARRRSAHPDATQGPSSKSSRASPSAERTELKSASPWSRPRCTLNEARSRP